MTVKDKSPDILDEEAALCAYFPLGVPIFYDGGVAKFTIVCEKLAAWKISWNPVGISQNNYGFSGKNIISQERACDSKRGNLKFS